MEPLIIPATEDTPEVILDPKQNVFKISQVSVPEDAYEFYKPVLQWLKEFAKDPLPEINFEFDLEYVNSASSKQLIQILIALEEIAKKSKVKIKWYYEEVDEDMLMLGQRFEKLADLKFEFIEL